MCETFVEVEHGHDAEADVLIRLEWRVVVIPIPPFLHLLRIHLRNLGLSGLRFRGEGISIWRGSPD